MIILFGILFVVLAWSVITNALDNEWQWVAINAILFAFAVTLYYLVFGG